MRQRIASVVGARPQLIKAAAVTRALNEADTIEEVIIHTGQHFDPEMSDVFFEELGIPSPSHHLGISGGSHGEMTGRMLIALERVIRDVDPDLVLVYGDTNSTLSAALAAAKLDVPLAHVEAGLRSFNRSMPEEVNRVVADHVSSVLFCPTTTSVRHLAAEGIADGVYLVGDVMYDIVRTVRTTARERSTVVGRLGLDDGMYSVVTLHRAENTSSGAALRAMIDYARRDADPLPLVFPVHPRTRKLLAEWSISLDGFVCTDPLGYVDMARLLQGATTVYTDSGGLQKEAYFHRVPCVTLRNETEWVETIEAGWNRLWTVADYVTPRRDIDEYGDGHAAERIVNVLTEFVGAGK